MSEAALAEQAAALLGVAPAAIGPVLGAPLESGELVAGTRVDAAERLLARAPFARAETNIAPRLQRLAHGAARAPIGRAFRAVDWAAACGWLATRHQIHLAPEQAAGVRMALAQPVSIRTGGPGTGKTHPLTQACARSTFQRLPTWRGAGTPRRAMSPSSPSWSSRVRVGPLS